MVSKFNLLFFCEQPQGLGHQFFFFSMAVKWLTISPVWLQHLYYDVGDTGLLQYSLYLVHCFTQRIAELQRWWTPSLSSPGIPFPCPAVSVDVLFKGKCVHILVSSIVADLGWGGWRSTQSKLLSVVLKRVRCRLSSYRFSALSSFLCRFSTPSRYSTSSRMHVPFLFQDKILSPPCAASSSPGGSCSGNRHLLWLWIVQMTPLTYGSSLKWAALLETVCPCFGHRCSSNWRIQRREGLHELAVKLL